MNRAALLMASRRKVVTLALHSVKIGIPIKIGFTLFVFGNKTAITLIHCLELATIDD
ncbi:MAG: hypothetical protein ACHBN1_25345 [Heteroscytonema crispum UTEX LB 1556]